LVVTVPAGLQRESSDNVQALVVAWMKTWLRGQATEAIAQHGQTAGLRPRTIRIKKMTTRWGSCGPRNDINLNWLLAFTPPEVLEYVVVHEICHIRYRNHSPQFWGLVARHLPEYGSARVWLKQRGAELLRRFP
jgi:predicted metal-dependent hydrolase